MGFFSWKLLKPWTQSGHSFPKLGHSFPILEKGQGRLTPYPPLVTRLKRHHIKYYHGLRKQIFY